MKRKRANQFINILLAFALIFGLLATSTGSALAKKDKHPSMDPDFLTLVQENPEEIFRVIVQRDAKNKDLKDMELESEALMDGGKVKKQLGMIESFSAEMSGKELEKLAKNPKVRWISPDAPVVSTSDRGILSVLDHFDSRIYSGNNGSRDWGSNWTEVGDDGQPTGGKIRVRTLDTCESGFCLIVKPNTTGDYIYRQMNLSNAVSATLSFFRNNMLDVDGGTSEEVKVEISPDGGVTWITLETYSSTAMLGAARDSFNITSYMSATTQVRFLISHAEVGLRKLLIDNVQVEWARPSPFRAVIGANTLQENTNIDGQGVTVAVLDSGISDHVDLHQNSDNYNQAASSPSRVLTQATFGGYAGPDDGYAHGTHVAGIIAGNGAASHLGHRQGVAPGVNLVNVKVSNDQGMTYTSDVVEGMQWIYDNKDTYNIQVLNLSIISTVPESYHTNPLDAAAEILWFNGIVVVAAAGNNGTAEGPSTVYPPANDPFVITVGAIEDEGTGILDDDFIGDFSAYGTTEDGYPKPDIVAPGRNLVSLLAGTDVTAYEAHPKHQVDDFYFRMSGTSMSAPVVSGAIALLLQDEPNLTPDQVKYRLMATANQSWPGYDAIKAGAGTVNAYDAVNGTSTGSANQGITPSYMLASGDDAVAFDSVGWNSVGWNSVGWNSVGWNSVGWNSVGWNSVGWNTTTWDD